MQTDASKAPNPIRDLIDPFIAVLRAPRALWAVNITYFLEGLCYFGIITLLAIHFNRDIGLNDVEAGIVTGVFTGGITLAMFFFGELADRWGVRRALLLSLSLMAIGRVVLTSSDILGGWAIGSPMFFGAAGGLLLVVLGYGMYMPASYAAVRQFTTGREAAMGYAMLYALMNLGAFLPALLSPPLRQSFGIRGVFWLYTALTVLSVILILLIMTRRAVAASDTREVSVGTVKEQSPRRPFNMREWLLQHPLRDVRFTFFIFILIPVQTLFAHQWLTLPQYVDRSFAGWVSDNMELFVNINPILIFILTPLVTALTYRVDVYRMMIAGTLVMAAPTFLLALGPSVGFLFVYILLMSAGEAMWQPRFLQFAAEIAPEGKTGQYMGIAQLPWFLTKLLTSLYSGYMLTVYCPEDGPGNTEILWLFYGFIAMITPVSLFIARHWMAGAMQTSGRKP
jgi:proton-dependent oligopeptide transporter, POT family